MAGNQFTTDIIIKGHDRASAAFGSVAKNVNAVTGKIKRASRQVQGFGQAIGGGMAIPVLAAVAVSMRGVYKFDEAINQVAATAQLSESKMKPYSKMLRGLGKTTQFTAIEAAEGFNFLIQAGLSLDEAAATLPATLNLAAAGNISLAKAADLSTNAFAGFGMASNDVVELKKNMIRLKNVVAFTATKSNTNVPQMFMAMKEAAPISRALGVTMEKTAAILGVFADKGVQGAEAGRAYRTGMLRLIAPTKKARAAFASLDIDLKKYFKNGDTVNGSKMSNALKSQGLKIDGSLLQDIIDNSTSDDLLGELVDKVVSQVGDSSVDARIRISEIITESFAANAKGLDIFGLLDDMKAKGISITEMERVFGKMQVAKFLGLMNTKAEKGYRALHKTIDEGADGASKKMAAIRMRGMVGAVKRFNSAVSELNLSFWDGDLGNRMNEGLEALTGVINGLTATDVDTLVMIGKGVVGLVLGGAALTSIARLGSVLITLGGGLTKAFAGAVLFSPYIAAGGALILGLGYLASAYGEKTNASNAAANAEKEHADQLDRVDKILGRVTKNSKEYGENLNNATHQKLTLEVAKLDKQIPEQRKEISGNLQTSGWGASSGMVHLDDNTKKEIDQIRLDFDLGNKSIKETSDALYALSKKSVENALVLDAVIKNVHRLGMTTTAKTHKELILSPNGLNRKQIEQKVDERLGIVKFTNNTAYDNAKSQIISQKALIKHLQNPIAKTYTGGLGSMPNRHLSARQAKRADLIEVEKAKRRADLIEGEKSKLSDMQIKMDNLVKTINQQNTERKNQTIQAELKGEAVVKVDIKVKGVEASHVSTSVINSGHTKAKVNVGTSMTELNIGGA